MPKSFYRRRSKLKHEDWTEEIEKWERIYQEEWFIDLQRRNLLDEQRRKKIEERIAPLRFMTLMRKEEEEKELLLDCDGKYCGHKRKIEMDGMSVCWDCGRELGRCYGSRDVGYHFRNHTMRGGRKK